MANRFVLNTISYHGSGAIKEIPGFAADTFDRGAVFQALVGTEPTVL